MDKLYRYLGLAARAGRCVSGGYGTEQAIRGGEAYLAVVAEDASENTKKHISDMCASHGVPLIVAGSREQLGAAVGKEYRASVALTDEGLANACKKAAGIEE